MDALPSSLALLDEEGTIVATNRAWWKLATDQGADPRRVGEGRNYLEICDAAASDLYPAAAAFGHGLRQILLGHIQSFEVDDHLVLDGVAHVVRGRAMRVEDPSGSWILVTHEDLSRPAQEVA